MKKQITSKGSTSMLGRLVKGIKNGWRSYSKAVDIAYSRGLIHHHPELCTGNNQEITSQLKRRSIKAAAFDEYTNNY